MVVFAAHCRNCAGTVSAFARTCERCGAPNASRVAAVAVVASLLILVAAIVVAAFVILRGVRIDEPAGNDFAWLRKAMEDCDAEAEKTPTTLHFLVVPMTSNAVDDSDWKGKSLNDIGNAILLNQQATLEALEAERLRISKEQYDFRMRDEATSEVYKWTPSMGVKKFLAPGGDSIKNFKVQFLTTRRTGDNWGATFVHESGMCYWVNAIIGN